MKKSNIWRFVWISSVFLLLIIIYKLVIVYKVEWETRDFNTYLYFYNCGDVICSSTTKPKTSYKKILCDDGVCPYITDLSDNILILSKNNISWLYDYNSGEIFHNKYINYKLLSDELYIFTDNNMKQGIMDKNGLVLNDSKYNEIIDYQYGMIVYKNNNLYGIDYVSGDKIISPKYKDVIIIDNTMYAARVDNEYQIYHVVNNALINNSKYDYIWSYNGVTIVVKNKQLDVLDNKLQSNLLMKINTYYSYNTKNEIKTLNIRYDDEYIYFNVHTNNKDYIEYKYNFVDKKISAN